MTHKELEEEYYDEQQGFAKKMGKSNRGRREDDRRSCPKKRMSRKDNKQMDQYKSFSHGK